MHSLTHSVLGCSWPPPVSHGQARRALAVSSHPCLHLHLQRRDLPQEAGAQLLRESTGRRQSSTVRMAGGNVDSPPPRGRSGSHFSRGRGGLAKCVSGQALLQGCHPTALPSNARPGRKPHLKTDQAEIAVALRELFDYQSQSCDVGTPPLPST